MLTHQTHLIPLTRDDLLSTAPGSWPAAACCGRTVAGLLDTAERGVLVATTDPAKALCSELIAAANDAAWRRSVGLAPLPPSPEPTERAHTTTTALDGAELAEGLAVETVAKVVGPEMFARQIGVDMLLDLSQLSGSQQDTARRVAQKVLAALDGLHRTRRGGRCPEHPDQLLASADMHLGGPSFYRHMDGTGHLDRLSRTITHGLNPAEAQDDEGYDDHVREKLGTPGSTAGSSPGPTPGQDRNLPSVSGGPFGVGWLPSSALQQGLEAQGSQEGPQEGSQSRSTGAQSPSASYPLPGRGRAPEPRDGGGEHP